MIKLKCFIACAFGKMDVDEIYTNAIVTILNELNIQPLRVDKIEHNENIDAKIIELIKIADFCITDLSYARPSAYFEAGYASGLKIPVIYTVRKDHFSPQLDDKFGNYKVHFDLQMKNIIDWTSTNKIKTFKKRLKARIKFVCQPIYKKYRESNSLKESRTNFKMMSIKTRLKNLQENIHKFLKKQNWKTNNKEELFSYNLNSNVYVNNDLKILVEIDIMEKANLKYLREQSYRYRQSIENAKKYNYKYYFIMVSLNKIPLSRIENAYPLATHVDHSRIIKMDDHKQEIFVVFLSDKESIDEYLIEFDNILIKIKKVANI